MEYTLVHLHDDANVFAELIEATAQAIALPQVYVEKDYWITKALRELSNSPLSEFTVFKGGTSLSKAYKLIHRFSEDIDLAVWAEGLSNNAVKNRLKEVERAVSVNLEALDDERVSKGSAYRKTVYRYPRHVAESTFGQASPELLIEVNAFTRPEPSEVLPLQTLIAEVLVNESREDLVCDYGLESFSINVLSVQRTIVEKLLGVIKDSYHDDPVNQLSLKIRHLYDLCLILRTEEYRAFIGSTGFATLCRDCIDDERKGHFKYHESLEKPLAEAPIFSQFVAWRPELSTVYRNEFSAMVYGDIPEIEEIGETVSFIGKHL